MKRKLFLLIATLGLLALLLPSASAAENDITVYVNDGALTSDVAPYLHGDRVLVPARAMSEALDFAVAWDAAEGKVTITKPGTEITLWIDSTEVLVNGESAAIDIPATIKNGRTFVPVRFVSEQLGQQVYWAGGAVHVYAKLVPPAPETTVKVSSAEQFLKELGPNKRIVLAEGVYDLTKATETVQPTEYLSIEEVFDGQELVIHDVSGLIIEGAGADKTEIIVSPRYANVLSFQNCTEIALKGLKAGHTPELGDCLGGVIKLTEVTNVSIEDCLLYGCGTEGINASLAFDVSVKNTVMEHCTNGMMVLFDSSRFFLSGCTFRDSETYFGFIFSGSSAIFFENCTVSNVKATLSEDFYSFFEAEGAERIFFLRSILRGNSGMQEATELSGITFEGCTIENNSFDLTKQP